MARHRETRQLDAAARAAVGGDYIELGDGVTHYELQGPEDGQVVVLLHGGTVPLWTWTLQLPALVEAGFRVLAYDMYGRGHSDRPRLVYDRELFRRQAMELIEALGLAGPVDLVGTSFGGCTAVNIAAAAPERVRRVALVAPVVVSVQIPALKLFRLPLIGEWLMSGKVLPMLQSRAGDLFEPLPDAESYVARYLEQMTYDGFARSFLSMIRSDALGDYRDAYRRVGAQDHPVLLVWGNADTEITAEAIAEARAALPGVEYHELDGVGHGSVVERPDLINELLVAFLQR